MYERPEMEALLARRSLQLVHVSGDFGGGPHGPDSERQILHVRA
jgi:hypothetical protein